MIRSIKIPNDMMAVVRGNVTGDAKGNAVFEGVTARGSVVRIWLDSVPSIQSERGVLTGPRVWAMEPKKQ